MHSYLEGEEEVNVLTDNQKFSIPYYYYIELRSRAFLVSKIALAMHVVKQL